jgi:hypothetical protein
MGSARRLPAGRCLAAIPRILAELGYTVDSVTWLTG